MALEGLMDLAKLAEDRGHADQQEACRSRNGARFDQRIAEGELKRNAQAEGKEADAGRRKAHDQ
jgi:hypothetical protein